MTDQKMTRRQIVGRRNLGNGRYRPDQPNTVHGFWAFLNGSKVPKKFEPIVNIALAWRDQLLSEEAMVDDPTPNVKRLAIIDSATRAYTICLLCWADLFRRGVRTKTRGDEAVNPILLFLARYENVLNKNIALLGLERRQRSPEAALLAVKQEILNQAAQKAPNSRSEPEDDAEDGGGGEEA